jgi:predicted metal-dependent phosphoesterase TrpH
MIRVDLHLHTVFSGDSTLHPKLVVDQLVAHPVVKGVAITDHNTLKGYFRVRTLASVYEDLVILPGIEISTNKGDMIMLGVEEQPSYPMRLDTLMDFAKDRDAVVIIPHPYRTMGIGDSANRTSANAIEVLNPTATPRENMLARKLAKARKLPGVAGTDAHHPSELWTVYTEMEGAPTAEGVLSAIRKGAVRPTTLSR